MLCFIFVSIYYHINALFLIKICYFANCYEPPRHLAFYCVQNFHFYKIQIIIIQIMANNHIDYLPFKRTYLKNQLIELYVFSVAIKYFCLSFPQMHVHFYFNYITYSGLLIFYCQNIATHLL